MAPASSRRVSYVIPPPSNPPPTLKLPPLDAPRNGRIGPILLYNTSRDGHPMIIEERVKRPPHPRHRLGVAALALDTATQLADRPTPEGILYTGGRDGMIISWELGIAQKKRTHKYGVPPDSDMKARYGRWEMLTGWADDVIDEEDDDEGMRSDGDIIGDVKESGGRRGSRVGGPHDIPYEHRWETDLESFVPGKPSQFRQSSQAHTDWVNDILLCNVNQTVVSGSSDGTIKTWNPHSTTQTFPTTIGSHSDYVRCLSYGRERNWIASGSFDRTIKLWDIAQPRPEPIITLNPPESSGPKSSVYALATDALGHVIASGSPERVVRTWDPRTAKRTGKLVGHTDNIRAILMSEDARYLLTGSADASIKLWSLASPQRCLHTFTHHTDSVWSLFSSHPTLEIFYSGDRSGLVCKVDVEGCSDIADGECVVICKEDGDQSSIGCEGINKIVVMDDNLVWTASGSSSVKRWRAPGRRAAREATGMDVDSPSLYAPSSHKRNSYGMDVTKTPPRSQTTLDSSWIVPSSSVAASFTSKASLHPRDADPDKTHFGVPYESLVRLASPNDPFPSFIGVPRTRDPEVATLYSAASVMSVPRHISSRSPAQPSFPPAPSSPLHGGTIISTGGVSTSPGALAPNQSTARADFEERDVAADATPLCSAPDDTIEGSCGLVRALVMNDRMHALTVDTASEVAVWDVVRAQCLGVFAKEEVANASHAGSVSGESGAGAGRNGDAVERSPRQALETVRERIEGEAVVLPWIMVDTRIGELTVHLMDRCFDAEIFADEAGYGPERVFGDEYRLSLGKWLLRNLFLGFIKEETRASFRTSLEASGAPPLPTIPPHIKSASELSHLPPSSSSPSALSSSPPRVRGPGPGNLNLNNANTMNMTMNTGGNTLTSALPRTPAIIPDIAVLTTPRPTSRHAGPGSGPPRSRPQSVVGLDVALTSLSPIPQSPNPLPVTGGGAASGARMGSGGGGGGGGGVGSVLGSADATPMPAHTSAHTRAQTTVESSTTANNHTTSSAVGDYFTIRRRTSVSGSGANTTTTTTTTGTSNANHNASAGAPPTPDDFSGWAGPGSKHASLGADGRPQTPSTPGGFMGRLKNFGKSARKNASEVETPSASGPAHAGDAAEGDATTPSPPKTLLQKLKSQALTPPLTAEAPPLSIPPSVSIIISSDESAQEKSSSSAGSWTTLYRGSVGSTGADMETLERVMPEWLLEFLLSGKAVSAPVVKIGFVLLPLPGGGGEGEALPELLNSSQSKLSASRFLRVRKLVHHVQEKLDKLTLPATTPRSSSDITSNLPRTSASSATTPPLPTTAAGTATATSSNNTTPTASSTTAPSSTTTTRLSTDTTKSTTAAAETPTTTPTQVPTTTTTTTRPRAEDVYEIVCNDCVLPLDMTLAAVRQFVWRQAAELVMYYRRKQPSPAPVPTPAQSTAMGTATRMNRT